MDWDEFEAKASSVKPALPLKPKRCWIGVLFHEKTLADHLEETDFIWMIGHNKIPLQKIHETYQAKRDVAGFELRHRNAVVDLNDSVKSFTTANFDPVYFHAKLVEPAPLRISPPANVKSAFQSDLNSHKKTLPARPQSITPPTLPMSSCTVCATLPPLNTIQESNGSSIGRLLRDPLLKAPPRSSTGSYVSPQSMYDRTLHEPAIQIQSNNQAALPVTHSLGTFQPVSSSALQNDGSFDSLPRIVPSSELLGASCDLGVANGPIGVKEEPAPAPFQNPTTKYHLPDVKEENQSPFPLQSPAREQSHHFDPEAVFNREPSPEMDSQEETKPTDQNIREVIAQTNPETLEAGVERSVEILESLKHMLSQYKSNQEVQTWIYAVDKLIPQAARKRTVVGVVGNTGAGKSSVINALLDEERLVPTNCMRACTAVVTEMSWNDSEDPFSKYRGEIDFISRDDWEKELQVLMKEFISENGTVSKEASNQDTDAGIAWAKFHAVYPKITKESLEKYSIHNLMSEKDVLDVLGTTKKIRTAQPGSFYKELQRYVDSKEKVTKDKNKDKDKEKQKKSFQMEYWPLIKVVKIYTKSLALSTGAVIVDLPGVHDSNAARAAVAQGYMKQCTGLWIVAPINRAVDDKAAKTLLGESFKRQLKYDGGFSSVTFICSKTDDISITEAIDSLGLDDEVADLEEKERAYKKDIERIENKIADLKESQDVYKAAGVEADTDIEAWEDLLTELDDGKTVFPPIPKSNKRKKGISNKQRRKKRHMSDDDSDDDETDSDDDDEDVNEDDEDVRAPQEPLTESKIKERLKELRETKKNARRESMQIKRSIDDLKPQIREIEEKIEDIKAKISRRCIAGRNEYSKTAIQQDFAAGIKELDQENDAEEDEDNFNPEVDKRDYEQVGKSLPVFCVSSRAYQQMRGRLRKDDTVPGFLTPEETEMPQLQAHCKKLTEAGRVQTCRTFLLTFCQLLTALDLWASNDGTGANMSDDDKRKQIRYLERILKHLDKGLEDAIAACIDEMRVEMKHQIFDKYPELIQEAIRAAPDTAQGWGAHKDQGGLHYMSYKATVRRDGVYQSHSAGHRDFNADLVNPIIKKLATGWERAFQHRLPKAFNTYISNSGKLLHNFHEAVEERARQNGVGLANLSILKTQICTYEQLFKDLGTVLITQMTELQREANRDFTPTIGNSMHIAYQLCSDERGMGSYKRMKEHMLNHVDRARHEMFTNATATVERHLGDMCKKLRDSMEVKADEIFVQMRRDYMQVLGGVQLNDGAVLSKEERDFRSGVLTLLRGVNAQFESIIHGDVVTKSTANEHEETQAEEPIIVDDDNDGAFESAPESLHDDAGDAVMNGNDQVNISSKEPSPKEGSAMDIETDNASGK